MLVCENSMKFFYLIRRRRRIFVNEGKVDESDEQIGSSGFFNNQRRNLRTTANSELTPTKSGLTKLEAGAKMKKDRIYTVDQEGNITKIPTIKAAKKFKNRKKLFDFVNLNIGFYIVAPILLGVFLGLGLDYWLQKKPFFFLIFLVLGTLASFFNLFKLLKNEYRSTH